MITATQIANFAKKAADGKWGYVWGGQGQLYNEALAKKWGNAKRSGKTYDYYVKDCARWFGHIIVDCSGLIVEAFRSLDAKYSDRSSTTFFNQCVDKGPISTIPNIPGLCVWRQGHIGIYIGDGKVVEAAGYRYGVIYSTLEQTGSGKKWTNWGKLKDVDYDDIIILPPETTEEAFRLVRQLKYNPKTPKVYMSGDDVKDVQIALTLAGYNPGDIDGKYGPKTTEAVKKFQAAHNLKIDGIVGPKTTAALGGIWIKK